MMPVHKSPRFSRLSRHLSATKLLSNPPSLLLLPASHWFSMLCRPCRGHLDSFDFSHRPATDHSYTATSQALPRCLRHPGHSMPADSGASDSRYAYLRIAYTQPEGPEMAAGAPRVYTNEQLGLTGVCRALDLLSSRRQPGALRRTHKVCSTDHDGDTHSFAPAVRELTQAADFGSYNSHLSLPSSWASKRPAGR
jgi:hypothetical protein